MTTYAEIVHDRPFGKVIVTVKGDGPLHIVCDLDDVFLTPDEAEELVSDLRAALRWLYATREGR